MLNFILLGVFRHVLTSIGGALISHGLQLVGGLPQVQDAKSVATGAILTGIGLVASALKNAHHAKLLTQSGPIYNFNR